MNQTTTDPAAHLDFIIQESEQIKMSYIDEKLELKKYTEEVLGKARRYTNPFVYKASWSARK